MKRHVSALLLLVPFAGVGAIVGCAVGADAGPAESFISTVSDEAGTEKENDSVTLPPSNPPSDDDDDDDDTDVDSGGGDAGVDAGGDGGTVKPDAGGGGTGSCAATNTCPAATNLGSVSGDKNADVKTAQGHTSQWFQIRVTEDDSSIGPRSLRLTAALTSPAGTNYDLYIYVPKSDTRECVAISAQSTSTTVNDTARVKFGEDDDALFANGSDDDRTVTVEVRHVSGTCDPNQTWALTVSGNKY